MGMRLTKDMLQKAGPAFSNIQQIIRDKVKMLLPGCRWSVPGAKPPAGRLCFEELQVARYEQGQHFLAHEEALPRDGAVASGYQRRATLLVYLNDVPEGGETSFDHLGVSIQPVAGQALLFFPAFAGNGPD